MRKLSLLSAALLAAVTASSADAALYVSGDINIFTGTGTSNSFTTSAPNLQFLRNIAGSNVLIQTSSSLPAVATGMGSYLSSQSIANTVLGSASTISAADLAGRSLFIGLLPDDGYTAGELAALSAFMNAGGSVFLTGENANFPAVNASINAALTVFGSAMSIINDTVGTGFATATIVTNNAATAGTAGFQYAAPSRVSGGTVLYATNTGVAFLAMENTAVAGVPEPATWAMMLAGFGAIGFALRRRPKVRTTVSFA